MNYKSRLAKTIFLFILAACTVFAQELLLKDRQLVVTLGNSITEGGERPAGYVSMMRKAMEVLYPEMTVYVVNVGISGHKSTDMDDRFDRDVLQYKPDWVTISVGVNDVWHGFDKDHPNGDGLRGVPLPLYQEKVTHMIQGAQAQGTRVMLFTATVIKENLNSNENKKLMAYNQAIRVLARKFKCVLADQDAACRQILLPLQKPGMADKGVLTNDGVHMLPSGNWLMARTALLAFGVPLDRLDRCKSLIDKAIEMEQQSLDKNASRYQQANYEAGMPREGEKRVVFFGSSSIDIWPFYMDFPRQFFLNRGISGETSREMVQRFYQDVISLKPFAAVIFLGSCNDFWSQNKMPVAETKSNVIKFARMAQGRVNKLAFGAVMPVNDYLPNKDFVVSHPLDQVQALNVWIKDYCEKNGFTFVDFYSPVVDASGNLARECSDDGMHCNRVGYERWKPVVTQALKDMEVWREEGGK